MTSPATDLLADNGIDVDTLSRMLRDGGFGGTLVDLEAEIVGTGQVGENVRCRLTWSDGTGEESGPASVVIKLPSSVAASRAAAEATRTYIREVGFYRDLAASVAIRVPTAHHIAEDRANNAFVLVMEDITPAAAGDQLAGCSVDQAVLAVTAAADLHGSTWGRDLTSLDWIDERTDQSLADRVALYGMLFEGFAECYGDRLSEEDLSFGRWLAENMERWLAAGREPQCLVHGDFRLDNMLFGTGEPAPALTTVDWQTPANGTALSDVAYFVSGSLEPTARAEVERDLLEVYRSRLTAHGVDLSAEDVLTQYRLATPAGYAMAVIASQLVGRTDRGDEMFLVMARGSAAQARDLDTAALLEQG